MDDDGFVNTQTLNCSSLPSLRQVNVISLHDENSSLAVSSNVVTSLTSILKIWCRFKLFMVVCFSPCCLLRWPHYRDFDFFVKCLFCAFMSLTDSELLRHGMSLFSFVLQKSNSPLFDIDKLPIEQQTSIRCRQ